MTMRQLFFMRKGKADFQIEILKVERNSSLWAAANVVSAIMATAGKSCNNPPNAKQIYEMLTAERGEPVDERDSEPVGSLAALHAEREAREAANGKISNSSR